MKDRSARHTPGPWHISETRAGFQICEPGETTVAAAHRRPAGYNNNREQEANARLIAAAPALLDACKALVAWQEAPITKPEGGFLKVREAMKELRAAIAKAEGSE